MAKIRITYGECTIEADSRDLYIDNKNVGKVIDGLVRSMQETLGRLNKDGESDPPVVESTGTTLDSLDEVETFEPEFCEPEPIPASTVMEKIRFLASQSFFETPRTVSESVEQMREHGWAASPLDVSKALAKMAFNKEILKNSHEQRNYYSKKRLLTT